VQRRSYFAGICQAVAGAEYVLYFLNDRLIGFNLLIDRGDVLVDKYLGTDATLARAHNLYFVSWLHNLASASSEKSRFITPARVPN